MNVGQKCRYRMSQALASGRAVAFDDPADPEQTDCCQEQHEHLAERNGVIEFKNDCDGRKHQPQPLAESPEKPHRKPARKRKMITLECSTKLV